MKIYRKSINVALSRHHSLKAYFLQKSTMLLYIPSLIDYNKKDDIYYSSLEPWRYLNWCTESYTAFIINLKEIYVCDLTTDKSRDLRQNYLVTPISGMVKTKKITGGEKKSFSACQEWQHLALSREDIMRLFCLFFFLTCWSDRRRRWSSRPWCRSWRTGVRTSLFPSIYLVTRGHHDISRTSNKEKDQILLKR